MAIILMIVGFFLSILPWGGDYTYALLGIPLFILGFVYLKMVSEKFTIKQSAIANDIKQKREQENIPHIEKIVRENFDVLWEKQYKLIIKDSYGNLEMNDWWKELEYFVENVVFQQENIKTISNEYKIDVVNHIHKYLFKLAEDKRKEQEKVLKDLETNIKRGVTLHIDTLKMKYKQTIYLDDYGTEVFDGWWRELEYFIQKVIHPQQKIDQESLTYMVNYAHQCFCELTLKDHDVEKAAPIKTGIDYEHYIEQLLQDTDFIVSRTPTTGDQGVDLIATKNGSKIAIQCKYYSKPVGNKAVQEVAAGKNFYECDYACVVSNNSFTPAARKLASNLNISLLNEDNLAESLTAVISKN